MTPAGDPRRVLHAIAAFGQVSESFLVDRLVELERAGWEAWVATLSVANRDLFPFPPDERILRPRRSLPARLWHALTRRYEWPMDEYLDAARPRLVHAHFGWTAAEVLPAVKRAGLPLVAGFHGYDATVFPRHGYIDLGLESAPRVLRRDPYRRLFAEADCVIAVSRFVANRVKALGFGGRIEIVPSGIRLSEFPFRGPRPDDGEVHLLFVGRQVAYKGLDVLIEAVAALGARGRTMRLDVIGAGPTLDRSRALAREHGVEERIAFHGEQPRAGVVRALQAADVLVAPSRTMPSGQAEGLSNVVKEALAVGVQVVASSNGGIPEVVPPSLREELVPENDAEALADRLATVLDGRDGWEDRARVAREWIEREFDWSRLVARLAAIYDDLAGAAA